LLTKLKQKVQQVLTFEAKAAHKLGLTPNMITAIGLAFAFLSAFAYAEWQFHLIVPWLAFILLLLSGFCDALDGIVARIYGESTVFGGFLDSLLDRYADAAVFVGIIIVGLCYYWAGLLAIIGSLLVSYSRARAEAAGFKMESVGLAERAERMLILLLTTLIAIYWLPALNIGVIIIAALANVTVVQRAAYVYVKTKKKESVKT
jgi:archaetidylinositol phosphate synthase